MNPILALIENDSPDKFAEDVANAYFANPDHVRRLLNTDCIEECVDYVLSNQRVEFDLSDLPFFEDEEPLFAKPSRQKGRRKHDKKAVKRKGSAKRFRDRSRKCASEGHTIHVYNRGMVGDWGVRGHRLAETGQVACKTSHRVKTNCADFIPDDNGANDVTMTFGNVSMTMNQFNWKDYENQWDAFCNSYAFHELLEKGDSTLWDEYWDKVFEEEEEDLKNGRDLKTNLDKGLDDFDDDDDEIIGADCTQEQDTAAISAIEMADIVNQIAYATPDECVKIREFFRSL